MIQVNCFQIWILMLFQAMGLPSYVSATGLGHLSVLKPTIIGRSITVQLNLTQPLTSEQFANCTLKVIFNGQKTVQTIQSGYSRFEYDGMKWMVLDRASVNSSWNGTLIHVSCNHIVSNIVLLVFQDEIPVLGPVCRGLNCTDCLCVKPGDRIQCFTSSTKVTLRIGNRMIRLQSISVDVDSVHTYIAMHDTIKEDDHQMIALCSAAYEANAMVNASSFVYVYLPPKDLTLFVPELLEDSQVNISCIAQRGRPPPKLEMYLDGENITDVSQHYVFDENTSTYTSVATLRWVNRTWNNKNITCRLLVRNPDGKYLLEKSMSTTVNYRYRPEILNLYANKTCGHSEEVCLTCFVRGNPPANISLSRPGQDTPISECVNTTACSITISTSGTNLSEYECMASNVLGMERQTIVMYADSKGQNTQNSTDVSNPLEPIMIGVGGAVMAVSTVISVFFIRELRRRREHIPTLIPLKCVSGNTKQHDDLPVATVPVVGSEDMSEHEYAEIEEELQLPHASNKKKHLNETHYLNLMTSSSESTTADTVCSGANHISETPDHMEAAAAAAFQEYEQLKRSDSDLADKYTALKHPRASQQ